MHLEILMNKIMTGVQIRRVWILDTQNTVINVFAHVSMCSRR